MPTNRRTAPLKSKGKPAPRQRVYARKDDVVLRAAERTFLKHGFAGTSMDMVADVAGVSKRTVYSNFGSKQALFAEVIKARCANVPPEPLDPIEMKKMSPAEVLEELAVRFLRAIYHPAQIALYRTVVTESAHFPEIGQIMFDGPIMRSQGVFDAYFREQMAKGAMVFPDPDLAAAQFVGLIKTNIHMRLLMNRPTKIDDELLCKIARASVKLFMLGAETRPNAGSGKPKER